MFPPSSRINNFSYSSQNMFNQPSTNQENPNPNPNPSPNPSSFFFPFSNPLLTQNNDSLNTHFVSQSLCGFDTHNTTVTTKEKPSKTRRKRKIHDGDNPNLNPKPRKRTGKSDRHSKIFTAQGPRDRRMRLSVHIARKFFDLQDMLGFDKASKTIEWLFSQSRDAIRELALTNDPQMSINQSSLSNCENGFGNRFKLGEINDGSLGKQEYISLAKETRDKARARARERTREKMIIGKPEKSKGVGTFEGNPNFEELGFLGSHDQEAAFPLQEVLMIDNFMGAASSSTSNSIFDFDKDFSMSGGVESSNSFMGIFGNWDMMVPLTGNVVLEQSPNLDSVIQFQSHFQ